MNLPEAPAAPTTPQPPAPAPPKRVWVLRGLFIFLLLVAALVRIIPKEASPGPGYDELLYRGFVIMIDQVGWANYPAIADVYRRDQSDPKEQAKLPPTRATYIAAGWLAKHLAFGSAPPGKVASHGGRAGDPALVSLCRVSWLASWLLVAFVGLAAWRMFGARAGVCALALAAVSPVPIHLARGAFIDGWLAVWATLSLWLLWENLQRPNRLPLLAAFAAALAGMVATKENSFFVYLALCGLVTVNRWAKFGTVTPRLLLAGLLGPTFGVALLVTLAGGIEGFIEIYRLLVTKAQNLPYAVWSGDGPWYRYLIDLLTVDPIVLVLALTGLFTLPREHRGYRFLLAFVLFSYVVMCNVRYGMNLRYTVIWLLPLSAYASAQIELMGKWGGRHAALVSAGLFLAVGAYEIRQYHIFFVQHEIYELVPEGMFRAINILKTAPFSAGW